MPWGSPVDVVSSGWKPGVLILVTSKEMDPVSYVFSSLDREWSEGTYQKRKLESYLGQ